MNKTGFAKILSDMKINRSGLDDKMKELIKSVETWAITTGATEDKVRQELLDTIVEQNTTIGKNRGRGVIKVDMDYHGSPFSEH